MGFELVRIATSANGLKVPNGAKCCFCRLLVEDGICLSGCGHSACYQCMKKSAISEPNCPIDDKWFNPNIYKYLPCDIEDWLRSVRMKCRWFDGQNCTATGVALLDVRRHEDICPNNPENRHHLKMSDFTIKNTPNGNLYPSLPKCDTTKIEEWIKDWSTTSTRSREGGDKSLQEKSKPIATQTNTEPKLSTNDF